MKEFRSLKRVTRLSGLFIGILAILSLSGCIGFPTLFKKQPFTAIAAPIPQRLSTGQPQPSAQRSMGLDQCLEIARRNNPSLASGAWDIQTSMALRNYTASERWPNVSNVDSLRQYVQNQRLQAARLNGEPGMFSSGILAVDILVKMPVFTGGRIRSDISAAELTVMATENRLARTWEELIFNVSSAFYTILGQRKLIESLEFSRNVLTKHKKRVQDMMSAGKAARVDVLRTEVRIADLDQRLVREKSLLEIQRRLLTTLMGVGLDGGPVYPQGGLGLGGPAPDLDGSLAMAFSERGDYRAARASLDAQAMKVRAARGALWPKVTLDGAIGMRTATGIDDNGVAYTNRLNNTAAGHLRGLWPYPDSTLPVGSMGVVADYPIFDGGRIRSQISEQETRFASQQQQLRKLALQIRLDVETAIINVNSARERVFATKKAIEQSEESFRIEQEKYDLGKGSITDVLDAQSAMLEAQSSYYRSLAEYNIAVAQLGMATGEKR